MHLACIEAVHNNRSDDPDMMLRSRRTKIDIVFDATLFDLQRSFDFGVLKIYVASDPSPCNVNSGSHAVVRGRLREQFRQKCTRYPTAIIGRAILVFRLEDIDVCAAAYVKVRLFSPFDLPRNPVSVVCPSFLDCFATAVDWMPDHVARKTRNEMTSVRRQSEFIGSPALKILKESIHA